jgi:hypothetical protein
MAITTSAMFLLKELYFLSGEEGFATVLPRRLSQFCAKEMANAACSFTTVTYLRSLIMSRARMNAESTSLYWSSHCLNAALVFASMPAAPLLIRSLMPTKALLTLFKPVFAASWPNPRYPHQGCHGACSTRTRRSRS